MEKSVAESKPVRVLRRTKSECSEDVAEAIYSSPSKEQRRQSYEEALEHFKHSNSRVS